MIKQPIIAIIGAGSVGTTTAYALMLTNTNADILLIDVDEKRCAGEVLDLSDTLAFSQTKNVHIAKPSDAANADIIIITAGQKQKPGQSRTELLTTNKQVVTQIFKNIGSLKRDALVIMVSNPLDILTAHAQELSGLPKNQVFGSGTYLDTQRIRGLLANKLQIAREAIEMYVIGEHGDSQVPLWSTAHINGMPILNFPDITQTDLDKVAQETKEYAYKIIECKGSTFYGIGTTVAHLCNIILYDKKEIVPLSSYSKEYDVCFSLPVILGRNGIEKFAPVSLDEQEKKLLKQSADILKKLM